MPDLLQHFYNVNKKELAKTEHFLKLSRKNIVEVSYELHMTPWATIIWLSVEHIEGKGFWRVPRYDLIRLVLTIHLRVGDRGDTGSISLLDWRR
jgi:hypothetical protein